MRWQLILGSLLPALAKHCSGPELPVKGQLKESQLVLDAGCQYDLYESKDAAQCLQGRWVVLAGSSNALLQFNTLVNFLAPDEYNHDRHGEMIGIAAVVDVIIRNGKVTYWQTLPEKNWACRQLSVPDAWQRHQACEQTYLKQLKRAPAVKDDTRITFFTSYFWYRSSLVLNVVAAEQKRQNTPTGFVNQIGAWYRNCMHLKFRFCPRKELFDYDMMGKGMELFKEELTQSLEVMKGICNNPLMQLGCYIQTVSWSDHGPVREMHAGMNSHIKEALKVPSKRLRLVDLFELATAMPTEVLDSHGSIKLNLWVWNVMLNGMCDRSGKTFASFHGAMCSGQEFEWSKCPKYKYKCDHYGPACWNWECLNSVPCTLRAGDPPKDFHVV